MTVVVALSLLHFVWQGAAIGAVAWFAMKLARTANARYYIGVAALGMMAASPVVTAARLVPVVQSPVSWVQGWSGVQSPRLVQSPVSVRSSSDSAALNAGHRTPDSGLNRTPNSGPTLDSGLTLDSGRWTLDYMIQFVSVVRVSPSLAKLLLASWLLGVGLLSVRLSFGLVAARRLTRMFVRQPRLEILSNAERLMAALRINGAVTVLESALVQVPTAMGWLKPVVLLPAQAMTGLSIAQIDALVAHELAHIKRHDYLVNLLQSAIETLLFYHPAVWLVSRRVRHERELCCDDMAIKACGDDRLTYASALAELESLRQMPEPMLAANGGSLLTRVKRILAPDDVQTVRGRGHWMAGVAILLTALVALASQRVQGRQVVTDLVTGAAQTVSAGVTSAAKDLFNAATTQASKTEPASVGAPESSGDVVDGAASVDSAAEQKITAGQLLRLEVMVSGPTKLTQRQADILFADAYRDWNTARLVSERARAERDRLASVELSNIDTAVENAKSVPGLSTDSLVVNYLSQLQDKVKDRALMKAESGFADGHYKIVGIDSEIVSIKRQLKARLMSIVDGARLSADAAIEAEVRSKLAYDAVTRGGTAATPIRDPQLSKEYTVQEDGTILLPYAGKVKLVGLTIAATQTAVRAALRAKQIMVASVLVSVETRTADSSVFVIGSVERPGAYPFRLGMTLAEALALAGPIPTAPSRTIRHRDGRVEQNPDVNSAIDSGGTIIVSEPPPTDPKPVVTPPAAPPVAPPPAVRGTTNPNAVSPPRQVPGYVIGPNDVVRVTVFSGGISQSEFRLTDYTVQADGSIALPLIRKPVVVGGKSVADANALIEQGLLDAKQFESSTVDITVMAYHSSSIKVQGAVRNPGNVEMTADRMNVADVLSRANGLLPSAGTQIRVRRAVPRAAAVDVRTENGWEIYPRQTLDNGGLADVQLSANDTVDVPVAPHLYVVGAVAIPGEMRWEPRMTLERALLAAGGVKPSGATNRITIRRMNPQTKKVEVIKLNDDPMTTIIEPDDVIDVPVKRMI